MPPHQNPSCENCSHHPGRHPASPPPDSEISPLPQGRELPHYPEIRVTSETTGGGDRDSIRRRMRFFTFLLTVTIQQTLGSEPYSTDFSDKTAVLKEWVWALKYPLLLVHCQNDISLLLQTLESGCSHCDNRGGDFTLQLTAVSRSQFTVYKFKASRTSTDKFAWQQGKNAHTLNPARPPLGRSVARE